MNNNGERGSPWAETTTLVRLHPRNDHSHRRVAGSRRRGEGYNQRSLKESEISQEPYADKKGVPGHRPFPSPKA